jgi:hypothetical protein
MEVIHVRNDPIALVYMYRRSSRSRASRRASMKWRSAPRTFASGISGEPPCTLTNPSLTCQPSLTTCTRAPMLVICGSSQLVPLCTE